MLLIINCFQISLSLRKLAVVAMLCVVPISSQQVPFLTLPCDIIRKLLQVPAQQSLEMWQSVITQYAQLDVLTSSVPAVYNWSVHMRKVHALLSHCYVESASGMLMYVPYGIQTSGTSFFNYCVQSGKVQQYTFYALFFDILARLFIDAINNAWVDKDKVMHTLFFRIAQMYCSELHDLHVFLRGSSYEHYYARQLRRYQDLIALVRNEE